MSDEKKKGLPPDTRVFLGKAYLVEVESKTYGLYRNFEMQVKNELTGIEEREKVGKPIGPLGLFRECEGDEKPDLMTFHETEKRPLNLKKIS